MTETRGRKPREIDELDRLILWELARDGRISNNDLAERVHASPSTTSARLRALRDDGLVQSIHAQLDWTAVGLPVQAVIAVRMRLRTELDSYATKIVHMPWVVSVSYLGGPDDFLIHVGCTSTEQLREVVATYFNSDTAVASTRTQLLFEHLVGAQYMDHLSGWSEILGDVPPPA
ncbi:Lrp/AsnC family transcriptional regulator [Herbiconiux moechotypicola]|uniref:Lrp/AsnC family transcriptional regulator n=1 Tax=Herbiconiux moechotypicola TaxID=637393 RepID=A0ABP5QI66_9MICO|nr:Lrp/AsnC family transcriptional regulator [Herbiconiux moechotypicola]MCS5729923.1 Lrp/AsnC family transcriptional regulator [Herbiconiux moechotypicola]